MKTFVVSLVVGFALFGCKQPEATFSEPQPKDVNEKSGIPARFEGEFENAQDSSLLEVAKDRITLTHFERSSVKISEIDSTEKLSGHKLVNLKTNESIDVEKNGDSISWHYAYVDTIYAKSRNDVLKKYKGYYFVNQNFGEIGWQVKKLKLSRDEISIADISGEADIEKLKALAETESDTVAPYKFKTTKKQFKKFVNNDGFAGQAVFFRKTGR